MGRIPDRPCDNDSQNAARSAPKAEITPIPVTTTRRSGTGGQFLHSSSHLPDSPDTAGLVIWNADIELVLKREQYVNPIQGIDFQFLERAVGGNTLHRNVLGCGDHLDHS